MTDDKKSEGLNVRDDAADCPECGSDCHALTETRDAHTFEKIGCKVACFECGALGPAGKDMDEAVTYWNAMDHATEKLSQETEA